MSRTNSGIRLGLGCSRLADLGMPDAEALIHRALDLGVTLFDTANVYGAGQSEALLGAILSGHAGRVDIATKFGYGPSESEPNEGAGADVIAAAIEGSLRRLRTDRIAAYFLHGPDPQTPPEETLHALHGLVNDGVVGTLGVSNMKPWQVVHASWLARSRGWRPFEAIQCGLNLRNQRATDDAIPAAKAIGAAVWAFSPLQKGSLALPGMGLPRRLEAAIRDVAHRCELTPAQVSLAWLASRDDVDVILVGTCNPDHLGEAHQAVATELSTDDVARLELAALGLG